MRRKLSALSFGGLLVLLVGLASSPAAARDTTHYECSLTGKTIDQCCCVQQKDGKLYCTLAKQTIDSCCCKEVPGKQ
jgi:hypothetical protein